MSRTNSSRGLRSQTQDVIRVASFLPELTKSARSLGDFRQHWVAVCALHTTMGTRVQDVQQELVLRTELPKQLLTCVASALQLLAKAGNSVSPEDPTLATAAHLASLAELLFKAGVLSKECRTKQAAVAKQTGEGF